ncbi:MAG: gliding motility protein GldC [Lewinellaceae bacterium]|nr:gliding motility protein GldC [Saprospiraceae bacterium]MCB9311238.1 gliding motility protein GldC [Lewinellaceae bacterium]HRW75339.1 gliding motility protein GldC [Saprospiraceae bacterium]
MDNQKVVRTSQIRINVGLNKENVPVDITWDADDQGGVEPQPCKAMFLSLFERSAKETLKIDLWTEDMQIVEMDRMIFHTLRSMAETYLKASNHVELAGQFQQFVHYFGEKTGILTPPPSAQ